MCFVFWPGQPAISTFSDISLLFRSTPSFTVRSLLSLSLSSSREESFCRKSPTERMRSPFSEVITSPAFTPAFSAAEPEFTERTRDAFSFRRSEIRSQLSVQIFGIDSQPRMSGV